jgi:acyl-CoA reductase-like NAD-dependent aldehyde dehydrogenase
MTVKPNLVAGDWVLGTSISRNINPSNTADLVGEYAEATLDQVKDAVQAARHAGRQWALAPLSLRAGALYEIGNEIDRRRGELALLLSREEGKALRDSTAEVARAAEIFRYYAGEVHRISGECMASIRPGVGIETLNEPVGVVGLITPWNFPLAIPAWKIAPALAYGNAVVFKPSEVVPASAWALADIISRSGVPKGVFNLLMGGGKVGHAIVEQVDAVSFTGSVTTGRAIAAQAAARMIPAQCELGGKNPLVIAADAELTIAVDCAVQGAFFQTGQRCTASSRLIVAQPILDRFTRALLERMQALVVDEATSASTDIGPVVDDRQLAKDLEYIRVGEKDGARRAIGGELLSRCYPGHYLSPALFVETTNDMRINREEIFGPVACIIPVRDYEEAITVANDTEFGLASSIVTTSLKLAHHFKANARSGLTMVNLPTAGIDYHAPLSGMKSSSYGQPEMGRHTMRFYTKVRTCYTSAC